MPRVYDETEAGERKGGMEKEKEKKTNSKNTPISPGSTRATGGKENGRITGRRATAGTVGLSEHPTENEARQGDAIGVKICGCRERKIGDPCK